MQLSCGALERLKRDCPNLLAAIQGCSEERSAQDGAKSALLQAQILEL